MNDFHSDLSFLPMDLEKHAATAVAFRKDAYVQSFGQAGLLQFEQEGGEGAYLHFLKMKLKADPQSVVHVWNRDQKLIGQMELGNFRDEPACGYVFLYYLVPEARGTGSSQALDEYASQYMRNKSYTQAFLSVSPSNQKAIQYYLRNHWEMIGPRANHPEVSLMKKTFF